MRTEGPRGHPNAININDQVKAVYLHRILPQICRPQTDPNSYGSTGVADIAVLQVSPPLAPFSTVPRPRAVEPGILRRRALSRWGGRSSLQTCTPIHGHERNAEKVTHREGGFQAVQSLYGTISH